MVYNNVSDSTFMKPPIDETILEFRFPVLQEKSLSNGLTLLLIEKPQLPKVYLRLGLPVGTKHDPSDKSGLWQLVASTLKKGTRHQDYYHLVDRIEQVGGELDVMVNEDFFILYGEFLQEHLEEGLDVLRELVLYPLFPPMEVDKEKFKQLSDLENEKSSPEFLAHRRLEKALYAPHPYASHRTSQSIQNVGRDDLIKHHQLAFTPEDSYLVIAGKFDQSRTIRLVEKKLSDWTSSGWKPKAFPAPSAVIASEIHLVHRPQSQQVNILAGNRLFNRRHPDFEKMLVLNKIVGGGASSRLFLHLREEKGYTYGAYSNLETYGDSGAFVASAEVRTEVTIAAIEALQEELQKIQQETVPRNELENARRFLMGIFPLQNETPASIAGLALKQKLYGLGENYWNQYLKKISQVNEQDISEMANRWINLKEMITVVVGDAEQLLSSLTQLGKVKIFDTDDRQLDSV